MADLRHKKGDQGKAAFTNTVATNGKPATPASNKPDTCFVAVKKDVPAAPQPITSTALISATKTNLVCHSLPDMNIECFAPVAFPALSRSQLA